MEKERLLMINNSLSNGGAERVMSMLANEFASRRYKVDMIIHDIGLTDSYELGANVSRLYFDSKDSRGIRHLVKWYRYIRNIQKKGQYDVIISFMMVNNVLTILAGHGLDGRVIVSERCDPRVFERKEFIFKIGEKLLYPHAHRVVFQTDDVKSLYKNSIKKRGVVIPNPVNPLLPIACSISERKKTVVSVGRFVQQKNFPMLLNAFALFSKRYPEYNLEIYGKGPLESEMIEMAIRLGIGEKVKFPGFVADIYGHIRTAKMFVLSSDFEGISNSMMEALSMGLPTICTDCPVGGARMIINSGENGILVPVGDIKALCDAMCRIASDEEFANRIGLEAQKIRQAYGIKRIADEWEKTWN